MPRRRASSTRGKACGSASASGIGSAVNTLIQLAKSNPDQVYETGNVDRAVEMSDVAASTADQLRACGMVDQADRLAAVVKDD